MSVCTATNNDDEHHFLSLLPYDEFLLKNYQALGIIKGRHE